MNTLKYEMSKTYQYRKVMKPMLERKRRARINKCLDELKDIISECMQQRNGDTNVKLEKADILELTVQHLRKIRKSKNTISANGKESFRTGYAQAANEVSKCLSTLPKVDITLGTKLMTHLGLRLNELISDIPQVTSFQKTNTPLNIYCGSSYPYSSQSSDMPSPVSSGYGSDSDYLACSSSPESLLKIAVCPPAKDGTNVWRPW